MKRLESHVESIVGPLRASERRKDRIREELLAHLEAAQEEVGTDVAIERFGSIEAVRAEIQASVPAVERFLWSPVRVLASLDGLFLQEPETVQSPIAFALRGAVILTIVGAAILAVTVAALHVLFPLPAGKGSGLGPMLRILAALAVSTGVAFYAIEKSGIRPKLDLRDPSSPAVFTACIVATIVGWGTCFLVAAHFALSDGRSASLWSTLLGWASSWTMWGAAQSLSALALAIGVLTKEAHDTKTRYARWGAPRLTR